MAHIDIKRSAELSPCGQYRWWLRRQWAGGNGQVVCFLMLNPSTADATIDDPTIRRCMRFAQEWGYSTLSVRNLFAYRATDPQQLLTTPDPIGKARGDVELVAGLTAHKVVAAWGAAVPLRRDRQVLALFRQTRPDVTLWCLGTTKAGMPRHPLYVKASQPLLPYVLPEEVSA